ncbi:MAG: 6-pyruvoyl-tetrahydropterin synthase-related protein [Oscillospiraceae bacterium]
MQPYRYWPPISYYIIAFLQNFTAGNVIDAYVIFSGLSFAIGGIGWLLWGIKEKRIMLCTFFSLIWFFLPDNMRVYFSEGNLPRMAVTMLLPLLFYFIWNFVERKEKGKIFPIIFLMALVTLTHVMVAAMVGVATAIFLLVYAIANKSLKMPFACLCGMFFGIALTGIWLVPALTGGIMNTDSSSIMEILYTKASVSLNPFLRLNGNIGSFYYGLAIFVISLIGIILSNKKSLPGFVTTIIIFAGTTVAFAPLVSKLPLSSLLWLRRFTPIAYALFVIAVINWKSCKKAVLIAICGLLVIDCLPSLQLNEYRKSMPKSIGFSTQDSVAERLSLKTAKSITNQRIALMDLSTYGPFPSYFISSESPQTLYTFGWAWQGATTGNNIVMLNEALETGRFNYLFDRCIELGNDTVVLSKEILSNVKNYEEKLFKAAELSGYSLAENGEFSLVFHKNTPKTFGTINEYQSLAIGSSANEITLLYPSFKQGNSYNIEDYSFEELLKYQVIYLSNFQYYDKINAENIVTKLSEKGVKIVIDMNRLPTNALTTRAEFLGVSGQTIVLNNNYPDIIFGNKVVKSAPFKEGLEQWNTVYIDGADETAGYSWINGRKVPVIGTKFNENLTFMGFNLLYHSMETGDENVLELMNEIFETDTEKLPKREIVPLDISFENEKITVNSAFDNVNTTLSFEDNFYSSEKISDQNNLLTVEKGTTTIYFKYPELGKGLAVMAFGTVGSVLLAIILFKKSRKKKVHKIV